MKKHLFLSLTLFMNIVCMNLYSQNLVSSEIKNSDDCFIPTYNDRNNFIENAHCSDLGFFQGWGGDSRFVNSDPDYIYCGETSIGLRSPWGGTLEVKDFEPNTVFRIKAKILAQQGTVARFALFDHGFGSGDDISVFYSSDVEVWEDVDFTFMTRANGASMYYVGDSGNGNVFIDNYEAYIVEEPYIVVRYLDIDGNELLNNKIKKATWGTDISRYIHLGSSGQVIEGIDKADIVKNGVVYRYNAGKSEEYKIIEEGENIINLVFEIPETLSSNADLEIIEFVTGQLIPEFKSSVTEYDLYLSSNNKSITPYPTGFEVGQEIEGDHSVDLTTGSAVSEIKVTAEDGVTTKIYTINYHVISTDDEFETIYSDRDNFNEDVFCSEISLYGGWGNKSVNYDLRYVYQGESSIRVATSWGGTLEINDLKPNTVYRFAAMVYATNENIARFAWFNHGLEGGDIVLYDTYLNNYWEKVDFTFKTFEDGGSVYFVGEVGSGYVYIDNYEVYEVDEPSIYVRYIEKETGMSIKEDFILTAEWGNNTDTFLKIGNLFTPEDDDIIIRKDEKYYMLDTSELHEFIIEEGENNINLYYYETNIPLDIKDIKVQNTSKVEYFDISGRYLCKEIRDSYKGIIIIKETYEDGNYNISKCVNN